MKTRINYLMLISLFLLVLASCEKEEFLPIEPVDPGVTEETGEKEEFQTEPSPLELFHPGKAVSGTKKIKIPSVYSEEEIEVTAEIIDGHYILEGDMVLGKVEDFHQKAIVHKGMKRRWKNGIMPYVITPGHPHESLILKAIEEVNQKSNLVLIERTDERDYVKFFNGNGCWSYVGRDGNEQLISIGDGCGRMGTIIHEILHAAGFFHEQSRCDRDQYVEINWDNIKEDRKDNFLTKCSEGIDLGRYDYYSIMHYPLFISDRSFVKDTRKPAIRVKSLNPLDFSKIGQRNSMSSLDINAINRMYPNTYEAKLISYDRSYGQGIVYNVENGGKIGNIVQAQSGWRKTWSQIVPFNVDDQKFVLFYEGKNGFAEVYQMDERGKIGGRTYSASNWRKTWDKIVPYTVNGKEYLLFYENDRGHASIYRLNSNGSLGNLTFNTTSWSRYWTKLVPYKVDGEEYLLFYSNLLGTGQIISLKENGTFGKTTFLSRSWRKTWDQVLFHKVDGREMMIFYEKDNGIAEAYRMRENGSFGERLSFTANLSRNWTIAIPTSIQEHSFLTFFDPARGRAETFNINKEGEFKGTTYSTNNWSRTRSYVAGVQ